jgi:4-hydroxybenzoate polyprenyltransferase
MSITDKENQKADLNTILTFLTLMRPQHWIKNTFVLAPLLFSRQFNQGDKCVSAILAFVSFSLVSSAIYIINDLCDRREDQQHPTKKLRPIASGAVTDGPAALLSMLLIILSLAMAFYLSRTVAMIVLLYAVITIVYSLVLKHLAILDVMTIAAGFVLRILAGSAAVSVPTSHWLVLCTIMISMFLGFTKRRMELLSVDVAAENTRKVLQDYSVAFLDQVISMVTAATIICYALYTVDARTVATFGTHNMLFTVPMVIYGLFRYIYIIYHREEGHDPTATLIRDVPTVINLVIWIMASLLVVKYGSQLELFQ